jgi:hypothetical protein
MVGFDYESIRDSVVKPKIIEFGKDAILTQPGTPTGPDYDPTPGTPIVTPVKVLELSPPGSQSSVGAEPGSLIRFDDRRFMMSTEGDPAPDLNGTLTVSGKILQVVSLDPNQPGPIKLFWRVRCRK